MKTSIKVILVSLFLSVITAASNSKWTTDVIGCFNATVNHGALNPPIVLAIEKLKAQ